MTGPPTWPASTCTRRRRPPRCAGCARPRRGAGFDRAAAADQRRAPPGASRRPRPADARSSVTEARLAALDAAAALGIVAVHECAGPDIGGLDDWHELRDLDHGVEVVGYWGEAVTTAEQARELIDRTGAAGWLATFSSTARSARAPRGCIGRTPMRPTRAATAISTPTPSPLTCTACTEAGVTAGFHVIGDAAVTAVVDALASESSTLRRPGGGPLRTSARTPRDGHRRAGGQLGSWGVFASMQPNFDALWGGDDGMYAQRLGSDRAVG